MRLFGSLEVLRIEGRPCLALPSGPNGRMIPRHKYYSNVAARLRHAPATLSRKSRSARSLTLPLRGLSCLQDHPQQRRALSTTPGASPSPPPLAPRNTIPCSTTVGVLLAEPGRHSSCSTPRRVFGASSNIRRLSAEAELTPTVATELEAGDQEHRQRRPRVRPKPGDAGNEEHEEEPQEEQERGESGKEEGKRQRVVVGMSGGVDSSVVAMLLQQQGYEVVGVFMRNWDGQDETASDECTADADLEDARRVGIHLGIPVETVDFSREYWNQVFEPSIQEFARCRTPNMDVACNRYIKFDAFREHALGRMAADLVATGHYARTSPGPNGDWSRPVLLQAEDGNKDQTYFLCGVPSEGLAKVLFPLGGLTKPEVRDLAAKAGLPVARKRESMGVCFVGKRRSWAEFISQYLTPSPGNFVCVDTGEVVGHHRGVQLYTVGQKSHLDGMPEKYYVAGLDPDTNSVIVAKGKDNRTLFARGLSVLTSEFNWIAGFPPSELSADPGHSAKDIGARQAKGAVGCDGDTARGDAAAAAAAAAASEGERERGGEEERRTPAQAAVAPRSQRPTPPAANQRESAVLRCDYRSRHRQALRPCTVEIVGAADGGGSDSVGSIAAADSSPLPLPLHRSVLYVRFEEPARAITPGQVLALYKDGVCLGGGPIFRAEGHCSPVMVRSPPPLPQAGGRPGRPRRRLTDGS